jgi:microcystin degradation protein MlrC
MRVFSAGIDHETNTFTNLPTGWQAFSEGGIWRGNAVTGNSWVTPVPTTFARVAREHRLDYVEGLYAAAQPAGPVVRAVYESLRDEILRDIAALGPFDMVLLHLEGAMVAEGYDDCEGDILARVRALVRPGVAIGAILDPHCHLTDAMVKNADVLVACKYYPHDDYADRAAEVFNLCMRIACKEIKPVPAVFDCKMVGMYPTTDEPMAGVVRSLIEAEQIKGILSASFIHGFPWGDVADTGSKVLVYADDDREQADRVARELGRTIYDLRHRLRMRFASVDEALDAASQISGLVVLADTADNAGVGAPGDNVGVLESLIRRQVQDAAIASIWDPQVAALCKEAGVGARLMLRLGGKTNVTSGSPLDVNASVRAISDNHHQTSLGDTRQSMGLCVWLEVEGIDVVVSSVRSQVFAPDMFTGLGIDLSRKRVVVVKSTNHFFLRFEPIAKRVIHMATPGAAAWDFEHIAYEKRAPNYFPRVDDPLSGAI